MLNENYLRMKSLIRKIESGEELSWSEQRWIVKEAKRLREELEWAKQYVSNVTEANSKLTSRIRKALEE